MNPLSHLPPHNIPLGHPRAPAPSTLYPALDIDWRFDSYMIVYLLQCHSPKSSHPRPLPLSPKVRYTHLCLFCCLAYRVVTEFHSCSHDLQWFFSPRKKVCHCFHCFPIYFPWSDGTRWNLEMTMMALYARQQKRHRCVERTFGLWGRGRGWDDLGEWHWNMYTIM